MSGPLAPNGPIINGVPVGSPTEPVYTPPKESHVLNDAILQAALDLRKRDRARRKIIFVISDGREFGSQASYRDVRKVLLSNEIQVRPWPWIVGPSGLRQAGASAPAATRAMTTSCRNTRRPPAERYTASLLATPLRDAYAAAMSEARNQYTLGYTPTRPKTPTAVAYRSIEVLVHRPGLKVYRQGWILSGDRGAVGIAAVSQVMLKC